MGNSNSRKAPPVVAVCKSPVYSVKRMGSRHLLLAGGGGAAATGVTNQIETYLLSLDESAPLDKMSLKAELVSQIRTDPRATMNMDVISRGQPDEGLYLIAAGQDQYCDVYETVGFSAGDESESKLSFTFRHVGKLVTDEKEEGYQKCVLFDRSRGGRNLLTGGSDGHIRVWNMRDLFEHRDPTLTRKPLLVIHAHQGDVDGVDISPDGRYLLSVGDGKAYIWDMESGKRLCDVAPPPQLATGYKVRTAHFTPLGEQNTVFVVGYNPSARTSRSVSFLALFAFSRERLSCRPIVHKEACRGDALSSLSVSPCGSLTGVGTMGGSVLVFDTHEFRPLYSAPNTHGIFVTGVEFLDKTARDVILPPELAGKGGIPAPAAGTRATLVSLSADQTVQVHNLPFDNGPSLSRSLLAISLLSSFLYYIVWTIFSFL